jgi:hypothetical protein
VITPDPATVTPLIRRSGVSVHYRVQRAYDQNPRPACGAGLSHGVVRVPQQLTSVTADVTCNKCRGTDAFNDAAADERSAQRD